MFENIIDSAKQLLQQFYARFVTSIIILLIGLILGRLIGKLLHKVLHGMEVDSIIKKSGLKFSLEKSLSSLASYFIYFAAVIIALNQLGLTTTVLNMISAAALILIIVSALLAIKDIIPNIFAGFYIYRKTIFKQGDKVKIANVSGKIISVSLVETEIQTSNGDMIYIPNSRIMKSAVMKKH